MPLNKKKHFLKYHDKKHCLLDRSENKVSKNVLSLWRSDVRAFQNFQCYGTERGKLSS